MGSLIQPLQDNALAACFVSILWGQTRHSDEVKRQTWWPSSWVCCLPTMGWILVEFWMIWGSPVLRNIRTSISICWTWKANRAQGDTTAWFLIQNAHTHIHQLLGRQWLLYSELWAIAITDFEMQSPRDRDAYPRTDSLRTFRWKKPEEFYPRWSMVLVYLATFTP